MSLAVERPAAGGPRGGFLERVKTYFDFTRPFTLLPPTFGVIIGM